MATASGAAWRRNACATYSDPARFWLIAPRKASPLTSATDSCGPTVAALLTSTSIFAFPSLAKVLKAVKTESRAVMSTEAMKTSQCGEICRIAAFVVLRGAIRRPRRAIRDAPAFAKERAVSAPMPVPPPVIRMVFPLAEREGRVGEIEGYVLVCHVSVGLGKGAAPMVAFSGQRIWGSGKYVIVYEEVRW